MKRKFGHGKDYELCGVLWEGVRCREKIQSWATRSGISERAWTLSEFGRADWIAICAAKYDDGDLPERAVERNV